jgi:hypothetical protein
MGRETWYRGEVAGAGPAQAGGHVHELGDGMYLTADEEIAWRYPTLKRSDTPSGRSRVLDAQKHHVYEVKVKRSSLGRVLDLTIDARWQKMMRQPVGKSHRTAEQLAAQTPQNYFGFFQQFLKINRLDREDFDAIIAWNYLDTKNGQKTKMMCIVSKKGNPSRLHWRIRTLFKPVRFRIGQQTAVGKLVSLGRSATKRGQFIPFRPSAVARKHWVVKVGATRTDGPSPGGRGRAGGALAGVLIDVLLFFAAEYLERILNRKHQEMDERSLKGQIERLEPRLLKELKKQTLWAIYLVSEGKEAYVNITIDVSQYVTRVPTGDSQGNIEFTSETSGPVLSDDIFDIVVTANDVEKVQDVSPSRSVGDVVQEEKRKRITFSREMVFPEGSVELYRWLIKELAWYQDVILSHGAHRSQGWMSVSEDDMEFLFDEREETIQYLATAFEVDEAVARKHVNDRLLGLKLE